MKLFSTAQLALITAAVQLTGLVSAVNTGCAGKLAPSMKCAEGDPGGDSVTVPSGNIEAALKAATQSSGAPADCGTLVDWTHDRKDEPGAIEKAAYYSIQVKTSNPDVTVTIGAFKRADMSAWAVCDGGNDAISCRCN